MDQLEEIKRKISRAYDQALGPAYKKKIKKIVNQKFDGRFHQAEHDEEQTMREIFYKWFLGARLVFDAGTGTGYYAIVLVKDFAVKKIFGCDIAKRRLKEAEKRKTLLPSSFRSSIRFEYGDFSDKFYLHSLLKTRGLFSHIVCKGCFDVYSPGAVRKIINDLFYSLLEKNGVLLFTTLINNRELIDYYEKSKFLKAYGQSLNESMGMIEKKKLTLLFSKTVGFNNFIVCQKKGLETGGNNDSNA